jgi:predicted dehydrogenase
MTIAECRTMIDTAAAAGIHIIVGHSHSFDAPYRRTRDIIASGGVGKIGMIAVLTFTDFMYRPRRPEELVIAQGGGVIFSQGAHQIDIIRLIGGGRVRRVRAYTDVVEVPAPGIDVPLGDCRQTNHMRGAVHMQITTIGLDIAKNVFQVHGNDTTERVVAASNCVGAR